MTQRNAQEMLCGCILLALVVCCVISVVILILPKSTLEEPTTERLTDDDRSILDTHLMKIVTPTTSTRVKISTTEKIVGLALGKEEEDQRYILQDFKDTIQNSEHLSTTERLYLNEIYQLQFLIQNKEKEDKQKEQAILAAEEAQMAEEEAQELEDMESDDEESDDE